MAKFCTKCGRKLEEGEVCNCQNENNHEPDMHTGQSFTEQTGNQLQQNQKEPRQNQGEFQQNQGNSRQYQGQYSQGGLNQQQYQGESQYGWQGNPNSGKTRESEWFNQKKNVFVSGTKNMFAQIMPILKSPVTAMKNVADGSRPDVGIELVISKAVIVLIVTLIFLGKMSQAVGRYMEIPYVPIIFVVLLLTAGVDFLEAFLMKAFSGIFNGATSFYAMITTVGARALYESVIIIVTGILSLISENVALVVFIVCAIILPYIQYSGFYALVLVSDDKKPYIFFVAKACMMVVFYILVYLFAKSILENMFSYFFSMLASGFFGY